MEVPRGEKAFASTVSFFRLKSYEGDTPCGMRKTGAILSLDRKKKSLGERDAAEKLTGGLYRRTVGSFGNRFCER